MATTPAGRKLYSPHFLSPAGYSFQQPPTTTSPGVNPSIHSPASSLSPTTKCTEFYWGDPRKVGSKVTESDGSYYYRGPGSGTRTFITHSRLRSRNFIKGDDAFSLFSLDASPLQTRFR
uniref:meprin A subunit beta-like n=1 Tax=Monopterus albus TaxID=43700 RepID=UPI0009B3ABD1|nr:meprin A subunit beta-like [Monopterus albus]